MRPQRFHKGLKILMLFEGSCSQVSDPRLINEVGISGWDQSNWVTLCPLPSPAKGIQTPTKCRCSSSRSETTNCVYNSYWTNSVKPNENPSLTGYPRKKKTNKKWGVFFKLGLPCCHQFTSFHLRSPEEFHKKRACSQPGGSCGAPEVLPETMFFYYEPYML